jgi:branched-chain amino acid aminotransferase
LEKIGPRAGIPVHEEVLAVRDLAGMSECFLLSTSKGVTPVSSIDDRVYEVGGGTVTAKLMAAFAGYTQEYTAAHPELAV